MAISSVGYDETVNELVWSQYAPLLGVPPCVISGAAPSIVTGSDRTVRIPAGTVLWGHGVLDTVEDNTDLQASTVSSGSRWDTVVARRDWDANATSLAIVQGTATKAVASLTNVTPGELCDTPVALVRVQAGVTALQEVVDLRYWASRVRWRPVIPLATQLDYGEALLTASPPGTELLDLMVRLGGAGSETLRGLLTPRTTSLTGSLPSGVTSYASDTPPTLVQAGGRVWLEGAVKRTNGFSANVEYTLFTLATALAPARRRQFAVGASFVGSGVAGRVTVHPTGKVVVFLPYDSDWASIDGASWYPKGS